ncbi:hypothetical protein FOZ60_006199 [Perkinsus olseni]|uniref:Uncharacterized protein n=1 Tax=Perkinsus olseni TaxID=32597 RepID=A0A7J6NPD3_PEROL|nr:hypothetical protein FOZ60_006199 [Perkinsus olseni]
MRHHVSMGLKLVSEVYVEYSKLNEGKRESLVEAGETREESKDSVSLGIIMLNSALLKGLHVLDCLQGRCVQEYPELTHDLEDHLMSFDGSLTTIYEGHQSQKVVGDVEEMSERLLNGKLIRVEHVNAALNSQKEWYEREKEEMAKRVKQLEGNCEELRNALEVSQKSRPVTAETCAGSNRDPVGTSGEILVYDSEDEGGGSVSIRRKETLDELDLVEPVPEFGCAWQSSSSCCELAAVSDDAGGGLSPNHREQSRSVCADLPKAQLTVKVPKRIGRFDVVDATPRAAPPPSIATDMKESSVDIHQVAQTLDDLNRQVKFLCERNSALEAENALLRSRCARFIDQLHQLGASSVDLDSPECRVALTRIDTPTQNSAPHRW